MKKERYDVPCKGASFEEIIQVHHLQERKLQKNGFDSRTSSKSWILKMDVASK
jgi:hypothetical protein